MFQNFLAVVLLLVSLSPAYAIEVEIDREITEGSTIALLLHRQITNLKDSDCIKNGILSIDASQREAFKLAGCYYSSFLAKRTELITPDGKEYVEIRLGTSCPGSSRKITDVITGCALR